MNRREQIRFVRELSASVVRDITARIRDGSVPDNWDGHELRRWLANAERSQKQGALDSATPSTSTP